jgi:hypothetical protein
MLALNRQFDAGQNQKRTVAHEPERIGLLADFAQRKLESSNSTIASDRSTGAPSSVTPATSTVENGKERYQGNAWPTAPAGLRLTPLHR